MSQVVVKKIPIRILGTDGKQRWVGEVVELSDGRMEYQTNRTKKHIYLDCPCKEHGACGAFTVSVSALTRAQQVGAKVVHILFEARDRYVVSIEKLLKEGVDKKDDFQQPEKALPIHEFVKVA